ncbi:capsid protein [Crucivirus-438]|nr:capsid protein [Crucivirus-438]
MAECACPGGSSALGNYFAKVGGNFGTRAESWLDTAGAQMSEKIAKRFKSWTGLGDYKISQNSLIQSGSGSGSIQTQGGSIFVSHREYLGEVITGPVVGQFNVSSYDINPANVFTFPWLASIAGQFEEYRPLGIIFEFKSTASDISGTNVAIGSVLMATEYDNNDVVYTNKGQMMNAAYAQETRMSNDALHGIECDPRVNARKIYYTRSITEPSSATIDANDYNVGRFFIATQGGGFAANQSIGSLYVHYEFELLKQQVYGGLPAMGSLHSTLSVSGLNGSSSPALGTLPFTVIGGQDLGISFVAGTNRLLIPKRFAAAFLSIEVDMLNGASYVHTPPGGWTINLVNCTAVPAVKEIAASLLGSFSPLTDISPDFSGTSSRMWVRFNIQVNDAAPGDATVDMSSWFVVTSGIWPASFTAATIQLRIQVVPKGWIV